MGLFPIPARSRSKSINLTTWDLTETPSENEIQEWLDSKRFENIALLVGSPSNNLSVIDIDKPDFFTMDFLEQQITDDDGSTIGFLVKTGRGYQLWFKNKLTEGVHNEGKPDYKIDLFVTKHIIIVPPSIHPNGSQYKILKSPDNFKPININRIWNNVFMYCIQHDPDSLLKPIMNPMVKQKIMGIVQDPHCDGSIGHNKRLWLVGFLYTTLHLDKQQILDFINTFNKWNDYTPEKTERFVSSLLRHLDNKVGQKGGCQ
jgi:hypothetical protein